MQLVIRRVWAALALLADRYNFFCAARALGVMAVDAVGVARRRVLASAHVLGRVSIRTQTLAIVLTHAVPHDDVLEIGQYG